MSQSLEYGNVKMSNTKIGDKVYYLQSVARGHSGIRNGVTKYDLVEIIGFSNTRWKIRYKWDAESFSNVTGNHLYTRESIESTSIKIVHKKHNHEFSIITDSAYVKKTDEGNFCLKAFIVEKEVIDVIYIFSGIGKLKHSKELERVIKVAKAKSKIELLP